MESFIKANKNIVPTSAALLRWTCLPINDAKKREVREEAISILNQLPFYSKIHWRLIPLLNEKANSTGLFQEIDAEVQIILKKESQKGIIRELAHKKQLNDIVHVFTKYGIDVILLKGTAFSGDIYTKDAPRLSNDIDIMVKSKDWKQAIKALCEIMDYKPKEVPGVLGDSYEVSFVPKNNIGAALDLHLSLVHPLIFNISTEELWENSVVHPSFGKDSIRKLSTEHTLLHQALHAYTDLDFFTYGLVDSFEIINQQKVDFEELFEAAKGFGLENVIYYYFTIFSQVFGLERGRNHLTSLTPSAFRRRLMLKLASSNLSMLKNKEKTVKYRLIQILAQYTFTSSIRNVLRFQYYYFKTLIKSHLSRL